MYFDSSYSVILSSATAAVVWLPYVLTAFFKFLVHYTNKKEIYLYGGWGWVFYISIMSYMLIKGNNSTPDKESYLKNFEKIDKTLSEIKQLRSKINEFKPFENNNFSGCKKIYIGEIDICIPLLKGMIECYDESEIKNKVDQFKKKGNTIHAYYLVDSLYKLAKSSTEYLLVTDCYKVFSINETHNFSITPAQLNEVFRAGTKSYRKDIHNQAIDKFDKKYDFLTIDSPVIIEEYEPHPNIKTAIILLKSNVVGKDSFSLMTLNYVIVKNRLLFYSYYLRYDGKESINLAKNRNDYYGLKLVTEN